MINFLKSNSIFKCGFLVKDSLLFDSILSRPFELLLRFSEIFLEFILCVFQIRILTLRFLHYQQQLILDTAHGVEVSEDRGFSPAIRESLAR